MYGNRISSWQYPTWHSLACNNNQSFLVAKCLLRRLMINRSSSPVLTSAPPCLSHSGTLSASRAGRKAPCLANGHDHGFGKDGCNWMGVILMGGMISTGGVISMGGVISTGGVISMVSSSMMCVPVLALPLLPPDCFSLLAVTSAALCHAFSAFASIATIRSCSF